MSEANHQRKSDQELFFSEGKYSHLPTYPGKPFLMPWQRAEMFGMFWPVREAARCWGCSYRAARLYLLRHPDAAALVRVKNPRGKVRWILTARADVAKQWSGQGNPDFTDPEWQRKRALRYWRQLKKLSEESESPGE